MAASQTVPQVRLSRNSLEVLPTTEPMEMRMTPHYGIVTLFGYGIKVHVNRGHLILEDGIGPVRRASRLPRVKHGLRRLTIIGSDGMVSLAALRWLADQKAAFVMLERNGSVLTTTGPVYPSDARLRRAQALGYEPGVALRIARELIDRKLAGQEQVALLKLQNAYIAQAIANARASVAVADSIESIHLLETQGANAYWSAWRNLPVIFPRNDLKRMPDHWLTFGTRRSPLTMSPRLAVNPPNAILNYLYAVLESEARLAVSALGLDPGLGVMHVDSRSRDSLACDLMEAVRPQVDAYVLDWMVRGPWRREWFFEERNGNCRLMGSFAVRLSETALTWARAIAPMAEWVARVFSASVPKPSKRVWPATRLTQGHRRKAKGSPIELPAKPAPPPPVVCQTCGGPIAKRSKICLQCAREAKRESFIEIARLGQAATHNPKAEALRGQTQKRQRTAELAWDSSEMPDWLDEKKYREEIQPRLSKLKVTRIASVLHVSIPYASGIRAGKRRPHPRHWHALSGLVGVSLNLQKKR